MDRFLNIGHCPGPGLYSVGQDLRVFEQKIVSNRSIFDASNSQERLKLPEMQAVCRLWVVLGCLCVCVRLPVARCWFFAGARWSEAALSAGSQVCAPRRRPETNQV
ncbi:hypothetical protein pipiens_013156 [Culex pipiens pipiens]|uniref:Uncharacterized protein n=1 Tax=Culex pipiens pipiens TaxID=38569 RepID=A0ABD1D279_CULPP